MPEDQTARWSPDAYRRNASFVPALGESVLELLDPQPGEDILDLGCGDGALTVKLRERGARVIGVDASPEFVAAAHARGLDVRLVDGHALAFENAFDAVFSNAALHWMRDHDQVLRGVHRALRRGGRFVAELGGQGNVAAIVVALGAVLTRRGIDPHAVMPWTFPTAERFCRRLEAAGFTVESVALIPRPTVLPTDMRGWLETFAGSFLAPLDAPERARATDEAIALLAPALRDEDGRWVLDYVRLRVKARA